MGLQRTCAGGTAGALLLDIGTALHQRLHVENQRHFSAAQNGRATYATDVAENHAKRLDHGLKFAEQLVDHDAGLLSGVIDHDNVFA